MGGRERSRTYVPRALLTQPVDAPRHWRQSGTLVMADISGFTRLSDRLARQGRSGSEALISTLNRVFTALLAATDDGGDLLKFGGDALLVFFEGNDSAERACHSVVGMQRVLSVLGRVELPSVRVTLRMSVGIHTAEYDFMRIGQEHEELLVVGSAGTRTVALQADASAGQALVSAETAGAVGERWLGAATAGGVVLKRSIPLFPLGTLGTVARPASDLSRFIPRRLREHLGVAPTEHQHRRATVGFIHVGGIDQLLEESGPGVVLDRLSGLAGEIECAATDLGVCVLGTDIAPDGCEYILVAGVPEASEDDEARLLRTARRIVDVDAGVRLRAGVSSGWVFAGDVGAPFRRTYTIMGDTVNLAARLMSHAAPGEVVAQEAVIQRSRTVFEYEALLRSS